MGKDVINKDFLHNRARMNLKDYYMSLPEKENPRTDFLYRIVFRTGKTLQTVRNWVLYGMRPQRAEYRKIISEETGIPESDLW